MIATKEAWVLVTPLLAEKHTVWTYDRRGLGGSGGAADYSLDREMEDLAAVVTVAGPGVHLVGHSFGAFLCLEAAAAHRPELRSLVLYEPPAHPDLMEDVLRRGRELLDAGDLEGFVDVFLIEMAGGTDDEAAELRSSPEVWARVLDGVRREPSFRAAEDPLPRGWQPERYRPVAVPTLLLAGALTHCPLFITADEIREAIPHAEVAVIDGQHHFAATFDPTGFAKAVLAFTAAHN